MQAWDIKEEALGIYKLRQAMRGMGQISAPAP